MTTLTQLIEHYCPDGVEFVKLGELEDRGDVELGRGKVISKKTMSEHPGDYPVYSSSASANGLFGTYGDYMFVDERITWSVDGGGKFFYRPAHKYSVTNVCGWMKTASDSVTTKYLYYALYQLWTGEEFDYTRKAHPSVIREVYQIPLPPREVQDAIVERLDAFAKLSESLDSEIVLREKRFEYFREQLLTFDESDSVEYVELGDVAEYSSLRVDSADLNADTFVGVDNLLKDRGGKTLSEHGPNTKRSTKYQVGDVLIGNIRPYLRKIWHAINEGGCSGDVLAIHPSKVDSRFLYWTLFGDEFWLYNSNFSRGGKMPRGDKAAILAYQFPLPSLAVQQNIADKLDTMQALIDNLKQERELRKSQFEYYREKLLSFNS